MMRVRTKTVFRTILLPLLGLLAMLAPSGARADGVSDQLRQALDAARASDWDEAVAALPPVSGMDRSHLPLLWEAATALQGERPSAAAHLLAEIRRLDPGASRPRIALEALWTAHPAPGTLDPDDLPLFPVDAETLPLKASDGFPAATVVTVSPKPFLALPPATEPRSGKPYERAVTVYERRDGALALRFVIHATGAVPDGLPRRAGRFLGALSILSDRMLGPVSRASRPTHVWLSPEGRPGAEQRAGSILVHGADAARSDLEWARELAHEWGHATLPGVDGFVEPEAWANGDLGERLYLPRMAEAGWLSAWSEGLDAGPYARRYVEPLVAAFARTGPVPKLLRDTTRRGYDHFLSAALYIAEAYGPATMASALDRMEGQRPADFLAAFRATLARSNRWTVTRAEGHAGPAPICFPAAGEYMLDGRRARPAAKTSRSRYPAGWTMLDWSGTLTVQRIRNAGGAR